MRSSRPPEAMRRERARVRDQAPRAQFCEDCRCFMNRLGPGGNPPCCDESVTFEEFVHG